MQIAPPRAKDEDPIFDALCYLLDLATAAARAGDFEESERIMKRTHDIAARLPRSAPRPAAILRMPPP